MEKYLAPKIRGFFHAGLSVAILRWIAIRRRVFCHATALVATLRCQSPWAMCK